MSTLMIVLLVLGLALLFAAPWLARTVVRRGDPVGLTRIIQAVAVVLLVVALLVAPRSPETSAFPPPPDRPPEIQ